MGFYDKELAELLKEKTVEKKQGEYFLSLYYPSETFDVPDLYKRVKSTVLTELKDNLVLSKISKAHQRIIDAIRQEFGVLTDIEEGVVLFVKFDPGLLQNSRAYGIPKSNIKLITLKLKPKKETVIGKTPDLDQLIWINSKIEKTQIITIDREKANIYKLVGTNIKKYSNIDFNGEITEERMSLQKYSPTRTDQAIFAPKTNKDINITFALSSEYLNKVKEEISKDGFLESADNIIILYSSFYSDKIEEFSESLKKNYQNKNVVKFDKILNDPQDLRAFAVKEAQGIRQKKVEEEYEKAVEDHNHFTKGWNEVTKADRQNNIDTLFIRPTLKKKGYVAEENLIYTYPEKDSKFRKNIGPYLVKNVIEKSGKLVLLDDDDLANNAGVAASLRY